MIKYPEGTAVVRFLVRSGWKLEHPWLRAYPKNCERDRPVNTMKHLEQTTCWIWDVRTSSAQPSLKLFLATGRSVNGAGSVNTFANSIFGQVLG